MVRHEDARAAHHPRTEMPETTRTPETIKAPERTTDRHLLGLRLRLRDPLRRPHGRSPSREVPRVRRGASGSAAALLFLVLLCGCGDGGGEEEPAATMEEARAEVLPNPFIELRPKAGDVLVPPQIGFRWRWNDSSLTGGDDPTGLAQGEFSAAENGGGATGAEFGTGSDSLGEEGFDGTPDSGEASLAAEFGATGTESGADGAGGATGTESGADGAEGASASELERTEAYPDIPSAATGTEPAGDRLFRVVMVDSIGAIYARTITSGWSIRVILPPHTEPGPYRWHVEQLALGDSTVIARSAVQTFEIR